MDTNVILDSLLARQPFVRAAALILAAAETGRIEAWIGATTVTTIHYVSRRLLPPGDVLRQIELLVNVVRVASVDESTIKSAIKSPGRDFEDNILAACAHQVGAEAIVTRDAIGFSASGLRVLSPDELVKSFSSG